LGFPFSSFLPSPFSLLLLFPGLRTSRNRRRRRRRRKERRREKRGLGWHLKTHNKGDRKKKRKREKREERRKRKERNSKGRSLPKRAKIGIGMRLGEKLLLGKGLPLLLPFL